MRWRTGVLLVVCVWLGGSRIARGDAVPPRPALTCPRGATIVGHGHVAPFCAPIVVPADAPCEDGTEIVEATLEIVGRSVGDGGRTRTPAPSTVYAEVARTCDASPGPPRELPAGVDLRYRGGMGPTLSELPAGCHRLRLRIDSPGHTCAVPPPPPPPPPAGLCSAPLAAPRRASWLTACLLLTPVLVRRARRRRSD